MRTRRVNKRSAGVFLDTSALYEASDRAGRRHNECADALLALLQCGNPLVTTDLVLAEIHGLTLGRLGPKIALALVDRVTASTRVELVSVGIAMVRRGIDGIRARPGRRISLVDATSFEVMRDRGIIAAFAIDADFQAEGFETVPHE